MLQTDKESDGSASHVSSPIAEDTVILFLSLKRHLEKLLPRLAILRHLPHLKPLAFLIQLDRVSHPPALGNLQAPLQRIVAHLRHGVGLSPLRR